jgi:NAD(P)-dependent dehydrogenase (short-subunit alcohol dehydrogenase family)
LDKKDRIDILAMDVTNASSVDRAAAKIGSAAIDVLINSAGITGKPGQKTGDVDYVSWAHVLHVNTMRPLRVTEAFVDHLARSRRKLVVTITSGMASIADNTSGGSIAYRSSKAAVNMVMRSAAVDFAPRGIPVFSSILAGSGLAWAALVRPSQPTCSLKHLARSNPENSLTTTGGSTLGDPQWERAGRGASCAR